MDMIGEIPLHIVGTGANRIPPFSNITSSNYYFHPDKS